jgi:hypothetical protein
VRRQARGNDIAGCSQRLQRLGHLMLPAASWGSGVHSTLSM